MPFIARWPNRVEPGSQSDQLISFVDFLATFADLTDADLKPDAGHDSFSFLPVLTGRNADSSKLRKQLVLRSGAGAMMMRDGDWKYIRRVDEEGISEWLFDLNANPDEENSQLETAEGKVIVKNLKAKLDSWEKKVMPQR